MIKKTRVGLLNTIKQLGEFGENMGSESRHKERSSKSSDLGERRIHWREP